MISCTLVTLKVLVLYLSPSHRKACVLVLVLKKFQVLYLNNLEYN